MIRRATHADVGAIVTLRREAAEWLRRTGSDQWNDTGLDTAEFIRRVNESINANETWVVENNGNVVATIAIDTQSDTGLWTEREIDEAVIVHRMITSRRMANQGLGTQLIELARHVAYHKGKRYVRLDAWNSNSRLHAYYERAGFKYVRTSTTHGTPSGTLYEIESKNFNERKELAVLDL